MLIVTPSRKFYKLLVAQGLKSVLLPGPTKGFNINLVGKQVLHVTVDQVIVQTEVGTSSGNFSLAKIFWFWTMMLKMWLWGSNSIIRSSVVPQIPILTFQMQRFEGKIYENPRFGPWG